MRNGGDGKRNDVEPIIDTKERKKKREEVKIATTMVVVVVIVVWFVAERITITKKIKRKKKRLPIIRSTTWQQYRYRHCRHHKTILIKRKWYCVSIKTFGIWMTILS